MHEKYAPPSLYWDDDDHAQHIAHTHERYQCERIEILTN
jgi:hypothetical protein